MVAFWAGALGLFGLLIRYMALQLFGTPEPFFEATANITGWGSIFGTVLAVASYILVGIVEVLERARAVRGAIDLWRNH